MWGRLQPNVAWFSCAIYAEWYQALFPSSSTAFWSQILGLPDEVFAKSNGRTCPAACPAKVEQENQATLGFSLRGTSVPLKGC